MLRWLLFFVAVFINAGFPDAARADVGALTAQGLRCEYLSEPLAIAEPHPRLTWTLSATRRAERQTAYRVLVASSAAKLASDEGDLWDSKKVDSAQTAHIEYTGRVLGSRQECHWKVRVWDRDGQEGSWSEPTRFEMGLLKPADWRARWIDAAPAPVDLKVLSATYATTDGSVQKNVTQVVADLVKATGTDFSVSNATLGGDPALGKPKVLKVRYEHKGIPGECEAAEGKSLDLPMGQRPYLRRAFSISKPVAKARLYATALGVYELSLNGERIGDQFLAPGWTDYRKRVRYQVYDVSKHLTQGDNALGALVGPGWFCGRVGLFGITKFYGDAPALLAQLEITYTDGSSEVVVTDESWKTHPGPLLMADMMKGETCDATLAIAGWDSPGLNDSSWAAAVIRDEHRNLEPDVSEPVEAIEELSAESLTEPVPGRWTFDLGQNMVGVVRLKVSVPRGTKVTIRHGEMLNPDGTLYTANLRGAPSIDTYTCAGTGIEIWQPRFTFHGFRYVELTGLPSEPALDAVTGIVLSSATPPAGTFECSDPRLNQLQSNIVWGQRGNYLSIPTDCPQRDERMGWMADTQVFVPTAVYNADIAAFMTKWMTDVFDAQRDDGAHSDVAPVTRGLTYGTPAWADAGVIVPWLMYETYGDRRLLERSIDSMIRWVEWCRTHSTGLLRDKDRGNDYGDWLSIKADTPKDVLGTAYFAHSTDLVARSLRVLGRNDDAAKYERLFNDIKKAFNAAYVASDGRIKGDTQTCYIMALRFDLLPGEHRVRALEHLLADVSAKGDRLSTGFVGVSHLLPVLSSNGHPEAAWRLLLQDEFPSWLYSVKHGATTIWERWDGYTPETGPHPDIGMNSFNHYALGSCGQWLFAGVAGIDQAAGSRGYEHVVIAPQINPALTSASATYHSIRGRVECRWRASVDQLDVFVLIPPNVEARVKLPASPGAVITEAGRPLADADGIRSSDRVGATCTIGLGSGEYSFTIRDPTSR